MKIMEEIISETDIVSKIVVRLDDYLMAEFSYIDNGTGKDIVCVPTQTMCRMKCQFCHTVDMQDVPSRNLTREEMDWGIRSALTRFSSWKHKTLLISLMGCGEPLLNTLQIVEMIKFHKRHPFPLEETRYAMSTMIPRGSSAAMEDLTEDVIRHDINLKLHFSLHHTDNVIRRQYMPMAEDIELSLGALIRYGKATGNHVEIHYSLMDGVNDSRQDADRLASLLKNTGFSVKFIRYNEKPGLDVSGANERAIVMFMEKLKENGIPCETYTPPGIDIGASCGQFAKEVYMMDSEFRGAML